MPQELVVTWDYRCPFARNAAEHVVVSGIPVRFAAFSLNQAHVAEGGPDVWDDPAQAPNLQAMQVGIVVRDRHPDAFPAAHLALFAARHDEGRDIREHDVLRAVLAEQGLDADAVFAEVEDGWPLETFRKEHEALVAEHQAFGVPTFVSGGEAVFVRLMHRPNDDAALARRTIERVVDLLTGWPELNEFKRPTIPR
jgi:hypothetical protein